MLLAAADRYILLVSLLCGFIPLCVGDCVWYGQCGHQPDSEDKRLNCPFQGPARPFMTSEARSLFRDLCPDLYTGDQTQVCCDDQQITTLAAQIAVPREALQRCPSCYHNFMNLWCYFTCAPNQHQFLMINQTKMLTKDNVTNEAITSVNYYLSEDSANDLFVSCQNVQNPSTNSPALSLLCGISADLCSPQTWMDFMGTTNNGQAPFDIWFHINNTQTTVNGTEIHPVEFKTVPCNQAPSLTSDPCSCQDCVATCMPVPPPAAPVSRCKVSLIDCYDLGFTLAYAVFVLIFGGYTISVFLRKRTAQSGGWTQSSPSRNGTGSTNGEANPTSSRNGSSMEYKLPKDNGSYTTGGCHKAGIRMQAFLEDKFFQWGHFCAGHPISVTVVVLLVSGGLCAGITLFTVTTDPVKLWSAPGSRARTEKEYFDSHFMPFYRTEQLVVTRPGNTTVIQSRDKSKNYTSLFDKDFLHTLLRLQDAISALKAPYKDGQVSLQDICFAPLRPDNNNCTIQSVLNYFQNSHQLIDMEGMDEYGFFVLADYLDHFEYCVYSPFAIDDTTVLHTPCLGTFGGPVFPTVALGGFTGREYRTSKAFVITILVNNHLDPQLNEPAKAWESHFVAFMKNYTNENPEIKIAFSSERSIEDEIERESESDIITILSSYLIMFGYVTICLGQYTSFSRILVDAKISLGLAGVLIVLLSVGCSLGFYSYLGLPSTLIIIEVVPFLVLAVGVDNIFILVQKYQREVCGDDETVEHMIGRVLGHVGPSMLLTSVSESLAFFLGALTEMPAVKVFSLYAALAVLIDFLLQISIFVCLLTLDAKRQEANRIDVLCCKKVQLKRRKPKNGLLHNFMSNQYSRFLLHEWVRPVVMLVFVAWLCVCGALTSRVSIGLDQSLSMPKDSYVLNYLGNLSEYLSVGAPVYFVVEDGHDYSTYTGQNDICGVSGCPEDSLVQQINTAARESTRSYIAQPVSSWLDDYFSWLFSPTCCRFDNDTGQFCPSTETKSGCTSCPINQLDRGRPVDESFNQYLHWYLGDNPGIKCSKGGHAAYGAGVELHTDSHNRTRVGATYFMTYHTILKTSEDYIQALKNARQISDNITKSLNRTGHNYKVFPYSIFYVFYEQYLDIVVSTVLNITYCLLAVLIITFLLLGFDLHSALIVVLTIIMITVSIFGLMFLWNIELNALSLVNIIMSIGISVEFCSHIVRAFSISVSTTRLERAKDALSAMGSSVLSGITLTKIAGIIMLAFSKSQLFQVFYFRMYLAIVVFGATHGLIFLPVLLSYVGPPINKAKLHRLKGAQSASNQIPEGTTSPPQTSEMTASSQQQQQPQDISMIAQVKQRPLSYNSISAQ